VLRNFREELEATCDRELKKRRGAARTADLNMVDGWVRDSVSAIGAMGQRKGEVWTLELEELSGLFCKHHDFFRDENDGHVRSDFATFLDRSFLLYAMSFALSGSFQFCLCLTSITVA
jgi:hypothetical protein